MIINAQFLLIGLNAKCYFMLKLDIVYIVTFKGLKMKSEFSNKAEIL